MKDNREQLQFAQAALQSQERTMNALRDLQAQVEGLGEYVATVQAENRALREALAFYADDGIYTPAHGKEKPMPIEYDHGSRARAALTQADAPGGE